MAPSPAWLEPSLPDPDAIDSLVRERQPQVITIEEWRRLDALEVERGKTQGRPRVKLTAVDEMLAALSRG